MLRPIATILIAACAVAALVSRPAPVFAQIGNIFSDRPRPPAGVPRGEPLPDDSEEEEVPDLPPQGRVLPTPRPPAQGVPMPGAVQSQPLPPPPGAVVPPPPATATAPGQSAPGVASAPNPPPGQKPQQPPRNAPPTPATLQPGDEVVTEPPAVKIVNKQAVFSGLDKITGRIINFEADIGETVQFGALRIKTDACYTRPSTESANTDAFVEVDEITLQGEVKRIFSGWMFAASPGLHGVEHPIYDVWLTDCKGPDTTIAQQVESAKPVAAPTPAAQKRPPAPRPQAAPRPQPQPAPPPGAFPPFRQ